MSRRLIAAAVTAALAAVLVLAPAAPASAAHSDLLPDPINVLPSTIKNTYTPPVGKGMEVLAAMIYKSMITPTQATAATAVKAGTATVTEAQLVASFAQKFAGIPAFKPANLVKLAGPVGYSIMAGDVGLSAGNGFLELIAASGIDPDANSPARLCTTGNDFVTGWVSNFNHVDCAAFLKTGANFVPNADASPGVTGGRTCEPVNNGRCIQLIGSSTYNENGGSYIVRLYGFRTENFSTSLNPGSMDAFFQPQGWRNLTFYAARANEWEKNPHGACFKAFGASAACSLVPDANTPALQRYRLGTGEGAEVAAASLDPERRFECRVKFTNGTQLTKQSTPFNESTGVLPPIVCPTTFPPELTLDETSIWEVGGGKEHMLQKEKATPEYQAVKTNMADCLNGSCVVALHQKSPAASCNVEPGPCADWFTDPNKASKYDCKWGTHVVDLAECTVLAPYYKPGAKYTTSPLGNPATGQPMPNPGTKSGTAGKPSTAGDTDNANCLGNGWSEAPNPAEWVMVPVKCALQWAFVPRQSFVADSFGAKDAQWKTTQAGKTVAAITALSFVPPPAGGCEGIRVDVFFLGPPFYIMNACPGQILRPLADFTRIVGSLVITVYGLIAVTRHVGRIFGYDGLGTGGAVE